MVGDGQHSSEYDAQTTEGILGEAAHLLRTGGFGSHHAILIGGMVPGLLVLDPPSNTTPHVGTTDLDFCLSIALVDGDTAEYQRIETALKAAGYEQLDASFRWQRTVGLRPTVATTSWLAASSNAVASPIPLDAPVMTIVAMALPRTP